MTRIFPLLLLLHACGTGSGTAGPDIGTDLPDTASVPADVLPGDACDSSPGEIPQDSGQYPEPAARVRFDLLATPVEMPYPSNYYRDPLDGHLLLDGKRYSNTLLPVMSSDPNYQESLATYHGFATYAPLVFLVSTAPDPASMPGSLEASVAADASIQLFELDDTGKVAGRVPFFAFYRHWDDGDMDRISVIPARALAPDTLHVLAVTDRLKTASGEAFGRSVGFAQVIGLAPVPANADPDRKALLQAESARLAPLVSALPEPDRVVAAVDFTTGHEHLDTLDLFGRFLKGGQYATVSWSLDGDGDGKPDLAWGHAYTECPMADAELAYGAHGTFSTVNLTGPDGRFQKTDQGWTEFPADPLEFWLMVPTGAGPFPVVIAQHGIDASHSQMCDLGRDFIRAGIAVLRFDWPRHGKRGSGNLDFLDIMNPLKVRDNFRQGAVDVAAAVLLIGRMSKELDRLPKDSPDGKGDLDADRIGYLGHSLGAIIGMLYAPFSDRIRYYVSNVGGIGMSHLVEFFVTDKLGGSLYDVVGIEHLAEHFVWPGDGVAFDRHVLTEPLSAGQDGKHVLVQEVIDDGTIPNFSTEVLARVLGVKQVGPIVRAVPGLTAGSAKVETSGMFQFDQTWHGALPSSPQSAAQDLMRRQAVEYLRSAFETGTPVILEE